MLNICNSLAVFPVSTGKLSDGGPEAAPLKNAHLLKMHHLALHILLGTLNRICCSRWISANLWDGIHSRILSELADVIAKPLSVSFEWSWESKAVPADWKLENIVRFLRRARQRTHLAEDGNCRVLSVSLQCLVKLW